MTDKGKNELVIFLLAGFGGLCRYQLGLWFPNLISLWLINLTGTFFLVFMVKGCLTYRQLGSPCLLGLGTGFAGGFTSFSSVILEIARLAETGQYGLAGLYLLAHLLGGLLVAHLALQWAKKKGWT